MNPLPLKKVTRIADPHKLPEPFRAYWLGKVPDHEPLERKGWRFYLVDDELYIDECYDDDVNDSEDTLLSHWTTSSCCGVLLYLDSLNLPAKVWPYVRTNGEYLFETAHTGDYETSAISPLDGKAFVVHSG